MGVPSAEGVGRKDGDPPCDLGRQPDEGEVDRLAADALEDEAAVEDVALAGVDEAGPVLERDDRLLARAEDAEGAVRDRPEGRSASAVGVGVGRRGPTKRTVPGAGNGVGVGGRGRGVGVGGTWKAKTFLTTAPPISPPPLVEGEGRDIGGRARGPVPAGAARARRGDREPGTRGAPSRPEADRRRTTTRTPRRKTEAPAREENGLIAWPSAPVPRRSVRVRAPPRVSRTVRIGRRDSGRK